MGLIVLYYLKQLFLSFFLHLAHCYEKVRVETQQMQDKIQSDLGLSPVEQEVIVLYDGEKAEQVLSNRNKIHFLFYW